MNLKYTKLVIDRSRFAASQYDINLANEAEREVDAMQARIEKLETAANKAVEWLHHYPSPYNMEEQTENNRRRAIGILENALKGDK